MFDFGKHADYMAIGYAAMAILLGGMVLWTYLRYRMLVRDSAELDQREAEEQQERASSPSRSENTAPARAGAAVSSSAAPKET